MKFDAIDEVPAASSTCRYPGSRLLFRGPKRPLTGRYIAFVGGTETYGKFIEKPFPALVEQKLVLPCPNFGVANASVDVFMAEELVLNACMGSVMNVVQITGAQNLTNRFYSVHPRRNDRFVQARSVLRALYPEVDFADYCFTRHLLTDLHAICPDRFEIVRTELQQAWSARMRSFLAEIGAHTLLLWFSDHLPSDSRAEVEPFAGDPLFVTRRMIDGLRPLVSGVVLVQPSAAAQAVPPPRSPADPGEATHVPMAAAAHHEAADALVEAIRSRFG